MTICEKTLPVMALRRNARAIPAYLFMAGALVIAPVASHAAPKPEELKKLRQQCSRLAEKIAVSRQLKTNTVQSTSNYNADKETCFAQIEISQILQPQNKSEGVGEGESQGEKRQRQILLLNATTNELLAFVMWEEPKGLRVGHIYDAAYDGPRDDYEKVDLYMRKKMALNLR